MSQQSSTASGTKAYAVLCHGGVGAHSVAAQLSLTSEMHCVLYNTALSCGLCAAVIRAESFIRFLQLDVCQTLA